MRIIQLGEKFYTATGSAGSDKSHLCFLAPLQWTEAGGKVKIEVKAQEGEGAQKCRSCCELCYTCTHGIISGQILECKLDFDVCPYGCSDFCGTVSGWVCHVDEQGNMKLTPTLQIIDE